MLFWTNETTVNPVSGYKCIGSGAEIATYVLAPIIDNQKPPTLDEAIRLATHALKAAKDADPYCGGKSEFAVIDNGGSTSPVTSFDISAGEVYSQTFQGILRELFFAIGRDRDGGIKATIEKLRKKAPEIRREQQLGQTARALLFRNLLSRN
jgi:hypothetical protein